MYNVLVTCVPQTQHSWKGWGLPFPLLLSLSSLSAGRLVFDTSSLLLLLLLLPLPPPSLPPLLTFSPLDIPLEAPETAGVERGGEEKVTPATLMVVASGVCTGGGVGGGCGTVPQARHESAWYSC